MGFARGDDGDPLEVGDEDPLLEGNTTAGAGTTSVQPGSTSKASSSRPQSRTGSKRPGRTMTDGSAGSSGTRTSDGGPRSPTFKQVARTGVFIFLSIALQRMRTFLLRTHRRW